MHVDAAEARRVEDFLRQDQAIGDDHGRVELKVPEGLVFILIFQRERGEDGDAVAFRRLMHGGFPLFLAASGGAGRLAVDGGDLVSGGNEGFQNGHGEVGCAHEGKPELCSGGGKRGGPGHVLSVLRQVRPAHAASSSSRCFFALIIFFRIMFRFRAEI